MPRKKRAKAKAKKACSCITMGVTKSAKCKTFRTKSGTLMRGCVRNGRFRIIGKA